MKTIREGGFLVSKVKQIAQRIFDNKLKEYGITDLNNAQGRIVFVLWQKDSIPFTDLVRLTTLSKTTLSGMLDRLEESGHVKRTADKKDKRKIIVSLTAKSRSLKGRYEAVSEEMTALFYKSLPGKEIDDFENTLKHILANLTGYEEQSK